MYVYYEYIIRVIAQKYSILVLFVLFAYKNMQIKTKKRVINRTYHVEYSVENNVLLVYTYYQNYGVSLIFCFFLFLFFDGS